ncbi:hypothetical protein HYV70_02750 [Candidatus Uhrbacteria bacterium]|nr:hypothetical protein [Candidatus Uhrbacteria bacterium]
MRLRLCLLLSLVVFCGSALAQSQANWMVLSRPTVVSIYNIESVKPDTLHIIALDQTHARTRCGGEGSLLVIFTDHGVPIADIFAPPRKPTGFREVYYDRDGDGQYDGIVLALDLATQTDVWITWRAGDEPGITYLHPSKEILVKGLGLQTIYRPTNKLDSDVLSCNMGLVSKPGGHRQIGAYQMTPRWN